MDTNKHMIQIQTPLYNEIKEFCETNNLKINTFINDTLRRGFMIEKYGDTPFVSYSKFENFNGRIYDEKQLEKAVDDYMSNNSKIGELSHPEPDIIKEFTEKMIMGQKSLEPEIVEIVNEHWDELMENTKQQIECCEEQVNEIAKIPVQKNGETDSNIPQVIKKPTKRRLK